MLVGNEGSQLDSATLSRFVIGLCERHSDGIVPGRATEPTHSEGVLQERAEAAIGKHTVASSCGVHFHVLATGAV